MRDYDPNFQTREDTIDEAFASLMSRVRNVAPYLTEAEAQFASWETLQTIACIKAAGTAQITANTAYEALDAQYTADPEEMAVAAAMTTALHARAALYHAIAAVTHAARHQNVSETVRAAVLRDLDAIRADAIAQDSQRYGLRSASETPLANPDAVHDVTRYVEAARAAGQATKHFAGKVKRHAKALAVN